MHSLRVAIDGPAGAGKSTVAKSLAKRLGLLYVDTGAMYRALTWLALRDGVAVGDEASLIALLPNLSLDLRLENGEQRVVVHQVDVTEFIRTPEIDQAVSWVSSLAPVRKWMVALQQSLAVRGGVVMDGRDIGTNVMPDADVKVYLTATLEERAQRRVIDWRKKGVERSLEEVAKALKDRDYYDEHREVAPARMADDAVSIDTTGMPLDAVIEKIATLCDRARHRHSMSKDEYNGVSS